MTDLPNPDLPNPRGKTRRTRFIVAIGAIGAILSLCPIAARAQDWPSHPVKVIVPYGPGGITDVIARLVADRLSKALDQAFVIENRGGAGGAIGTEVAARAPKDGSTIYIAGSGPITIVPQMQKLTFDPATELAPVGMIAVNGMALTVHPDLPVHSVAEFIAYVKARPGDVNYAVGGIGTLSHLSASLLSAREGLKMVAVPYQSMPPVIAALLSKTVDMFFGNISDVIEPVRSGKIRLLALSTAQRSPQFPDVAAVSETVPGFAITGWHGVFVPAGTPRPIVDRLAEAVKAILERPDVATQLAAVGAEPAPQPPEEFAAFTRAERAKWKAVVQKSGTRIE
jgi:tripartite-type tricarboxylate transporter receptor subunit TctC